jgi:hypothetical protein
MLDRDLEEAEEQYGMAVRAHMLVVESLSDLQYQRMKALEAEFALDLRALEVICGCVLLPDITTNHRHSIEALGPE